MRLIQLCVSDVSYPRNKMMREWLQANNHEVLIHSFNGRGGRCRRFVSAFSWTLRNCRSGDVLVLTELNIQYFLPTRLAGCLRGAQAYWVDFFVGMHETNIGDWREAEPNSLRALVYRALDALSLRFATVVSTDTRPRALAIQRRRHRPVVAIPVGGPQWATPKQPRDRETGGDHQLRLLFYAKLSPLHGHDFMLAGLEESLRFGIDWRLTAIVSGELRDRFRVRVEELGLASRVTLLGPVDECELESYIAATDVVLGIFGDSPKAHGVFPNKVWQGLLCARPVLTRASPAYAEWRDSVPSLLYEVDVSQSGHFAQVLARVCEASRSDRGVEEAASLSDLFRAVYTQALAEITESICDFAR